MSNTKPEPEVPVDDTWRVAESQLRLAELAFQRAASSRREEERIIEHLKAALQTFEARRGGPERAAIRGDKCAVCGMNLAVHGEFCTAGGTIPEKAAAALNIELGMVSSLAWLAAKTSPGSVSLPRIVYSHPGTSGYHDNSIWCQINHGGRSGIWLMPGESIAVIKTPSGQGQAGPT